MKNWFQLPVRPITVAVSAWLALAGGYYLLHATPVIGAPLVPIVPTCDAAPSGLVAWWPAEGNATDIIGTNNGTLIHSAGYTNGEVGQAFNLNQASSDYIQAPPSALWIFGTNDFTIELWANFRTYARSGVYYIPDATFIACDEGQGVVNKWMFSMFNGNLTFAINSPTLNPQFLVNAPFVPAVNQWYHLAVVRSGDSFTIYTNGVVIGTTSYHVSIPHPNAPLTIGQSEGLGYLNGRLDEISVYQRALAGSEIAAIYNAGSAGKCPPPPTPPFVITQPTNQTVIVGQTASFSVGAGGTAPLSYQWKFGTSNLLNATNATLTLASVQLTNAGSYSVAIASLYGTTNSASASLTVVPFAQTVLTLGSTNGMSGGTLTVPIRMNALGVENAFLGSVNYDTNKLVLQKVQLGQATTGAYLAEVDSQTNNGSVGFAILLNTGAVVPAGTWEVGRLVFAVLPVTTNVTASLTFGDSPTARQTYDNNLNLLPATYLGGSIALVPAEYEADVYPRTSGDHQVTVQDWLEIGRMVAGLDIITNSDEKLRADCAPRNAPDNAITVADWVQAGRYALGLDPLTLVTPPGQSSLSLSPQGGPSLTDTLLVGNTSAQAGQIVNVPVQLVGNAGENAVGLTVIYNPSLLAFISATLDPSLAGGRLMVNPSPVAGNVGLAVALPPGAALGAGTNQLLALQFLVSTNAAGTVPLLLDSSVVQLQVADLNAVALGANFVNGSVVLPPPPTLQTITAGGGLQLSWPVAAGSFLIQSADSPAGPWNNIDLPIITNGVSATVTVQTTNTQQFFRLMSQ
jgi:hypothetical protein